jgi:hypothetical protein
METNYNREDLIDLYLLDKLSSQERKDFEEEMLRNGDLCEEVEAMRRIMTGFERKGETEAINAMRNMPEEQMKLIIADAENGYKQPVKKTGLFLAIAGVVASITILLYIGLQPKYSSEELFSEYYLPEQLEILPSRGESSPEEKQNEIRFKEAIDLLEDNKLYPATDHLTYLSSLSEFKYQEESKWVLALVYLKRDQREESKKILLQLIETNSYYAKDAKKVVEKLEKRKWF